jgi:hypothetical protein
MGVLYSFCNNVSTEGIFDARIGTDINRSINFGKSV